MNAAVTEFAEIAGNSLKVAGLVVILIGTTYAAVRFVVRMVQRDPQAYPKVRAELGRGILLGLEVIVAADIVDTLLLDPTLEAVGALGLLVLVRTGLSWALSIEIDGYWPWQKWRVKRIEAGESVPSRH
ncbi:MAG: DUF1622 domain-containing protein [Actinomycetia bacterium]|nr:DUF1622 domain-containing protein [Actinomycetes bacterium]